jgi:hypothetical protein
MAFYDDKRWLLKHIRHSFITGDESQLCEHVLLNNDFPLPRGEYDSDDDQASDELFSCLSSLFWNVENTHRLWDTTVKKIPTSCGSLVSIDRS